ncbi:MULTISPECIES: outer membrane protein [unclassified Mesorhizobium]|uniref:outer membrane protein n=1 Tax=unclassified Mesorhizobium TaxID=325217 RepID=UPI000FCBD942|nr:MULTISPECIES: outer membrane protein [unclassified Mesorhizobium]RWC71641.1 MAG: porin family protein [Mesorhizobium sp.]RUW52117.1 porin family protein [Mesorhizobium sp. M8A.F.Ca.ET.021.01.1.1]TGP90010.1 porin family protein [Mesorhizobium sp. M8A.F.Ca.ET.218.01.1.1]TGS48423.1 porin family protein [Mesorhizobium sp. M8A.F.Ca.ET.182.01.1.1]TGS83286.1 porin family protein [Mesorhizobium sp. M8A.F.Ca.ET.181.01.1.1]
MKTILLATILATVPAGMAFAADATQTLPVAASYSWSGGYVGAQAGYAWGNARVGQTFAPGAFDDYGWGYGPSGGFGGLYAGYDKQFDGGLVLGIEGDYSFASVKDTTLYRAAGVDDPGFGGVLELEAVGSVRLRAGYAMDRWLPFVTGGLAMAKYKHTTVALPGGAAYADVEDTVSGYTLGAGAEYAVTDNWLVRGEYRFADFGRHPSTRIAVPSGVPLHDEIDLKTNDIRLGIAYKF